MFSSTCQSCDCSFRTTLSQSLSEFFTCAFAAFGYFDALPPRINAVGGKQEYIVLQASTETTMKTREFTNSPNRATANSMRFAGSMTPPWLQIEQRRRKPSGLSGSAASLPLFCIGEDMPRQHYEPSNSCKSI